MLQCQPPQNIGEKLLFGRVITIKRFFGNSRRQADSFRAGVRVTVDKKKPASASRICPRFCRAL